MAIAISCPHCRRPYRLGEKQAGKRVVCKDCGEKFSVPASIPPATEFTPAGTAIYRHQPKSGGPKPAFEATPFLPDIERHIERTIGPAPMVMHELVSEEVHIDLHVVPPRISEPSEERPWGTNHYTVVTSGLSSRPMNLPDEVPKSLQYAELMIALPPDWPGMKMDGTFDGDLMDDEANWWPMRWLKTIARLPHEYDTFIGVAHTIPNGDPAEPYAPNTGLSCMLVIPPLLAPAAHELMINDDITINFYALLPLYAEEMNFKLRRGIDPLVKKLEAGDITELICADRKNTCKRRWWPW